MAEPTPILIDEPTAPKQEVADFATQPNRILAQIVKIISISPIEKADKIELARVLGWDVVVKKGEYHVGHPRISCKIISNAYLIKHGL